MFGVTGDKYRTGPETNIQSILGKPVDLTARYKPPCHLSLEIETHYVVKMHRE